MVELIPYPDFEDVFVEGTNPLGKFVFLPLVTIKIKNHERLGDRALHMISIWDTGNHKKEYFGKYRTEINEISFDVMGDRLAYGDDIRFPFIEHLEKAHSIIWQDFKIQREYYLNDLEYDNKQAKIDRGRNLILKEIPEFGNFEAGFYFERITSALLSKYRYQTYGAVNSLFDNNSYYLYTVTERQFKSDGDIPPDVFNRTGKTKLIDNLLAKPEFLQNDESPAGTVFIGQVDEWHYISSESTNTFLFFDAERNKEIQIFQWD